MREKIKGVGVGGGGGWRGGQGKARERTLSLLVPYPSSFLSVQHLEQTNTKGPKRMKRHTIFLQLCFQRTFFFSSTDDSRLNTKNRRMINRQPLTLLFYIGKVGRCKDKIRITDGITH